jgi:hypothetical protein
VRAAEEVAHLNAQLERRLQHLQALRRIDMAITNAIDVGLALDIFLEQVQADLGVEAAGVLLYEPHARRCEPTAGRGFDAPLSPASGCAWARGWRVTPPSSSARCTSPTCAPTERFGAVVAPRRRRGSSRTGRCRCSPRGSCRA